MEIRKLVLDDTNFTKTRKCWECGINLIGGQLIIFNHKNYSGYRVGLCSSCFNKFKKKVEEKCNS